MKGTVILIVSALLCWLSVKLTGRSKRRFVQPVTRVADSAEVIGDYVQVPKA